MDPCSKTGGKHVFIAAPGQETPHYREAICPCGQRMAISADRFSKVGDGVFSEAVLVAVVHIHDIGSEPWSHLPQPEATAAPS